MTTWEARAAALEQDVIETGKAYAAKVYVVEELQRINGELLAERDEARRQLAEAQAKIEAIYSAAHQAVGIVAAANYEENERKARKWINDAYEAKP